MGIVASQPLHVTFRAGEHNFELDERERLIRRDGKRTNIEPLPFDMFCLLVHRAGELVTRNELAEFIRGRGMQETRESQIHPAPRYNIDQNISTTIHKIRCSLKESKKQMIEVIRKNGYRFIPRVSRLLEREVQKNDEELPPVPLAVDDRPKSLRPATVVVPVQETNIHHDTVEQLEICLGVIMSLYNDLNVMLHSIDETGVICDVNRKWLDVLGYQREEVIGRPADFLMTTESAELAMLVIIPEFWRRGFCKDAPYQYKTKDGRIIDVILNCVTTRDKTGKRISLSCVQEVRTGDMPWEARKDSKSMYDQRLQDESAGFYETDILGTFIAVNACMSRFLGYADKEELVGKNFREVMDSESAKRVFKVHHSVFTDRAPQKNNDWNVRTKEGKSIALESTVSLVTAPNGKPVGFRGVLREVTGT